MTWMKEGLCGHVELVLLGQRVEQQEHNSIFSIFDKITLHFLLPVITSSQVSSSLLVGSGGIGSSDRCMPLAVMGLTAEW